MTVVDDQVTHTFNVVNPTADKYGEGSFSLAPRLESLEGKTLGLLWNAKANGDTALKRAAELISAKVPNLTVKFFNGHMPCAPELLKQAAAESDAIIACTADCGSCSSWLTHDCIQIERMGVPTVIIASSGFEHDIHASAQAFAMPTQQFVVVPSVYNHLTKEETISQTDPVVDDVLRLLTRRLTDAELAPDDDDAQASETFTADSELATFEAFNQAFHDRNWTDGYPVRPPTPARVARLMEGIDGSPTDVVCILPPGNGEATVAKIAANAAMAGCHPEDMPVLMAALRAVAHKENDGPIRVCLMSTGAHAPLILVNGPIAKELGINGARCCLGPGKQNVVNTRIGRAFHMCLKNIARWVPGVMDLDSIGTARKNVVVLTENEDESPWEPYHVSQGYDPTDSTVTVVFTAGEWDISLQGHVDGVQLAHAIGSVGVANNTGCSLGTFGQDLESIPLGRMLPVPPPHAIPIAEAGFSKRQFEYFLWEKGVEPVGRLVEPMRKLYADGKTRKAYDWMFDLSREQAWQQTSTVIEKPELYHVVVAGSVRAKDLLMPLRTLPETELVTRTPQGADHREAQKSS